MAAATRSPLRRWERFFPAFAAIDDAIEAATGHPRGEFRSVRARIVGLLRGAENDGGGVAEELCAALDAMMEEALATLRVAASAAPPESTGLAESVVALSEHHESARVRGLAGDVVRRWTAAAEAVLVGAIRFMEVVNKHTKEPQILRGSAVAADEDKRRHAPAPPVKTKMAIEPTNGTGSVAVKKVAAPLLNKQPKGKMEENAEARRKTPAGGNGVQSEEMMASTKRKLREGYRQVEDAKRQRKIRGCLVPGHTSPHYSNSRLATVPPRNSKRSGRLWRVAGKSVATTCGAVACGVASCGQPPNSPHRGAEEVGAEADEDASNPAGEKPGKMWWEFLGRETFSAPLPS